MNRIKFEETVRKSEKEIIFESKPYIQITQRCRFKLKKPEIPLQNVKKFKS
jgi:hypothetical protein